MKQEEMNKAVENTSQQTISLLLPQWCQYFANNIPIIKNSNNISRCTCKTYPNCWKTSTLRTYSLSGKEHAIHEVMDKCKLSQYQISHIINNFLYDYNFVGTEICDNCKNHIEENKPCLVIAGGPSIKKYNHIQLLKEYGFKGDIICTDSSIKTLLDSGIIPKYMSTLDSLEYIKTLTDHRVIHENSDNITGLMATTTNPSVIDLFKGKKVFYNPFITKEYSTAFFLMSNVALINTCGNIGSTSIVLAHFLGYNPIVFIGMDLSFESFKDMDEYHKITTSFYNPTGIKKKWSKSEYKVQTNPIYNKEYHINKVFEAYKQVTLFMTKDMASKGVNIINCSEQGSLYDKHIKNMKFEDYLKQQKEV